MAISPTYPGVYVAERRGDQRTITGVSTSTALFVGMTKSGPIDTPTLCFNYSDYVRQFTDGTTNDDFSRHVRLFFINGGTQCYVTRIVKDGSAMTASTVLPTATAGGATPLTFVARSGGASGNAVRATVTYTSNLPESGFDIELFRWQIDSGGRATMAARETWRNLSMDPASATYAPQFLTDNSLLVTASVPSAPTAAGKSGHSISKPILSADPWDALQTGGFRISVGKLGFLPVAPIGPMTDATSAIAALETKIQDAIAKADPTSAIVVEASFDSLGADAFLLRLSAAGIDVLVAPAIGLPDAAVKLGLGTAQGGVETSVFSSYRPAPNGTVLTSGAIALATAQQGNIEVTLGTVTITVAVGPELGKRMYEAPGGLRAMLDVFVAGFNIKAAALPGFPWRATSWADRVAFVASAGEDTLAEPTVTITASAAPLTTTFSSNARYYALAAGTDGNPPENPDYERVYDVIDREVDLFNLMVLPPRGVDAGTPPTEIGVDIVGPASAFCQKRRAFLLVDAPRKWNNAQAATGDVVNQRSGVATEYAGLFYPRLQVAEGPLVVNIGASGAMAGLMARIDGERGVWKAPAGIEADLRGIVGVEKRFSDGENGVLNPKAINTIRAFPTGIVNWGARTMAGDDSNQTEYKYIPIRRLALFMEESLYRGLKWVVFEPNDEPLWSQIRLNVGAFMQDLFRKGAFQGATPKDAYFVRCDAETTTQSDRDLGIVNIWVGFAPLKPAEFVILSLQQMAGQLLA
ncbi:hypothetical protein BH09MYX1_BH09MYX1_37820 [soil metagenome]